MLASHSQLIRGIWELGRRFGLVEYKLEMDENCSRGMRRRVLMWAALASGSKVLCSYLTDPLERTRSGAGGPPGLAEETLAASV